MENNNISWMPYEEYLLRKEWEDKMVKEMLRIFWETGKPPERKKREDENVKLAWVININGGREMLGVDNKTMKGYAMREDTPTWKLPLEPVEYDTFERWCTTFDM
jgi:hypothetical protein